MLTWLSANLINIVLVTVLAGLIALVIRGMIRDRKAGKSFCGGSCSSCGACGGCGKHSALSSGADGASGQT